MSMIQIRNGLRFNIYASGVIDGVRYPNFRDRSIWPIVGITEVEEPEPPEDYTPEGWVREEMDAAPYVVWRPFTEEERKARVPQQVSRAQGKAVLIQMGLWPQVLAFVAAIPDDTQRALAEVALNDTQFWQRNSPFLNQAADALGIQEQMDDLFSQASQVQL